jgi:hypothetical protein
MLYQALALDVETFFRYSKKYIGNFMKKHTKTVALKDRLPRNRGEWLALCIKFTKRALTHPEMESQQYLVKQAERLKIELEVWTIANPTVNVRNL